MKSSREEPGCRPSEYSRGGRNQEGGLLQRILGAGCCAEWWPSLHDSDPDTWLGDRDLPPLPPQSPGDKAVSWKKGMSMGHNCSGWGGDPSGTQQGPQSSSLGLSLEWQAQHGTKGASASETRAGLWIHLLGLGTPGSSPWGHLGRPSGITVPSPQWTRRVGEGSATPDPSPLPPGGSATSSPWDPQPLLGRTPGAVRLDLHVHGADVARLVLSDPQLPVFGWVHFSKQLVHRLDCLQGTEKKGCSQRWRRSQGRVL